MITGLALTAVPMFPKAEGLIEVEDLGKIGLVDPVRLPVVPQHLGKQSRVELNLCDGVRRQPWLVG
jgi:hypothetical protein